MKKYKKPLIVLSLIVLVFISLSFVLAQEIEYPDIGGPKPGKDTTFPQYVVYLFNLALRIAGIVAFGVLVYGGVLYLISAGDPTKIGMAKDKIYGAFFGLILLLSTYIILRTINPDLVQFTLIPIEPQSGIYLVKADGTKTLITVNTPNLELGYTQLVFLSESNEIVWAIVCSEPNNKGDCKTIGNSGSGTTAAVDNPRSIFLYDAKEGLYLFSKLNYEGRPFYTQTSITSLSGYNYDFNDVAQSLFFRWDVIEGEPVGINGVVLFTDNDYRGSCALAYENSVGNLGATQDKYLHPIGINTLSSLRVFNVNKGTPGNVIFYDAIDCKGNKYTEEMGAKQFAFIPDLSGKIFDDGKTVLEDNILSIEINGNFGVVLTTDRNYGDRCQLFTKEGSSTCINNLKTSYVYDPALWGPKPSSFIIIPLSE